MIVKHNNLIQGFVNMSQFEYKFILYLISKIDMNDKDFRVQEISVKEFGKIINCQNKCLYSYMKKMIDGIFDKKIEIDYENEERLVIHWFSFAKYMKNKGIVKIAFNSDLTPYLLKLKANFTKYFLKNIKDLQSQHAIRLYELLKQYQNFKERSIYLIELKSMLGISQDQYKRYNDFKKAVLFMSQNQLSENPDTDLTFDFEEIKKGRKVYKIKFIIKSKDKKENSQIYNPADEIQDININTYFDKLKTKYSITVEKTMLKDLVEKYGENRLKYVIENLHNSLPFQPTKELIYNYFKNAVINKNNTWNLEPKTPKNRLSPNQITFEQRTYTDEEYEQFYSNVK